MLIDHHVPEGAMDDLRAGRFGFSVSVEPGEEHEVFVTRGISFDQEQGKSNRLPEEVLDVIANPLSHKGDGVDQQFLSTIARMAFQDFGAGLAGEISGARTAQLTSSPVPAHFRKIDTAMSMRKACTME